MNIIQNLHQLLIFWRATKIKKSVGPNTKNCIANYCKNATRCRIAIYQNLIESACCAQKNPLCNAIAGWPPNILRNKYQILKLCICKEHKCRPQWEWLDCNSRRKCGGPLSPLARTSTFAAQTFIAGSHLSTSFPPLKNPPFGGYFSGGGG